MAEQTDFTTVRSAIRDVQAAADSLAQRYPDSIDARRFAQDAHRLSEDLDLLDPPESQVAEQPLLEVIPDQDYPHDFWQDAGDEGLGQHSAPAGALPQHIPAQRSGRLGRRR